MKNVIQILFLIGFLANINFAFSQVNPATGAVAGQTAPADTVRRAQGDVKNTVTYSAQDSIRFDVIRQEIYLYGNAKVVYGDITLQAAKIEINWQTNILKASGVTDTTGKETGTPVFTEKGETYNVKTMNYNFKTRKGIISGITTKQDEGFIHGGTVKKTPEDYLFIKDGMYTTCDLPHPHFGIRARKLKVIPNKLVIAGPFNLEINDIPTPLGFAFGMFPQPRRRSSGFVTPRYGETRERGFYLADGGLYLALSENYDLKILGDIFSRGGWAASAQSTYYKRYRYRGNFNFKYSRQLREVPGSVESDITNDFKILWSHTPETRGTSRFSANVDAGTSTFNRRNSFQPENFISPMFRSGINYSKTFTGTPFSMAMSLAHDQNILTKIVNITPNMSVNMNRIYPFKGKKAESKSLIRQLNLAYNFSTNMRFTNHLQEAVFNQKGEQITKSDTVKFTPANFGKIISDARPVATHSIPVSTSTNIGKHLNFTLSLNYNENWFTEKFSYRYDRQLRQVVKDAERSFARYYSFNTSANLSTQLYAFYYMKPASKIAAIRHTMRPNISFNYMPDFANPIFGFFQTVNDTTGRSIINASTGQAQLYSLFPNSPSQGRSGTIGLGLTNSIEMKMRPKSDSAQAKAEKIPLLENLSINTSYNLAATEFQWSNLSISGNTRLLKKININGSITIDPYIYELQGIDTAGGKRTIRQQRVSRLSLAEGQGIGSISFAQLAVGTSLNPRAAKTPLKSENATGEELRYINANRHLYVDWNLPWNLTLNYTLNYSKQGFNNAEVTQGVTFNGDVKLTKNWKVGFNSGFDLKNKAFTPTQLSIYRDLHCWEMNATWIPFGPQTGYSLDIRVKAAILKDLKLSRRNSWYYR